MGNVNYKERMFSAIEKGRLDRVYEIAEVGHLIVYIVNRPTRR
jgi:hypothetical protein